MLNILSALALFVVSLCLIYLWIIAIGSFFVRNAPLKEKHFHSFAIVIPAHDEEDVIGTTIASINRLVYPRDHFDCYVVADYCTDRTAQIAREQGAKCIERNEGEHGGKATALQTLFDHIFTHEDHYTAIVVFDADTQVESDFLSHMNNHLNLGVQVVQGQHVISNPLNSWFTRLAWAMMKIDNRYSNQGRHNLKLSAKNMGDSICFRSEVIKKLGWGAGLTEDYDFRLRLLLEGICIHYEPRAKGYGLAAGNWKEAHPQRLRWAKGMVVSRKRYRKQLIITGLVQRNWSNLDGALGTIIPSFSTLTIISVTALLLNITAYPFLWVGYLYSWLAVILLELLYPLLGLALEKAPGWAYLTILLGPFFIFWRTWINLQARLKSGEVSWIRTPHKNIK
jgi:cellulose synthase/poly-beta-1,6-N-acetylglucosamine synthase-like glycosyltransferase